jgi:hypothetical protein
VEDKRISVEYALSRRYAPPSPTKGRGNIKNKRSAFSLSPLAWERVPEGRERGG